MHCAAMIEEAEGDVVVLKKVKVVVVEEVVKVVVLWICQKAGNMGGRH